MRTTIIANPMAGKRTGAIAATRAREALVRAGWEAEIRLTRGPRDAVRLARELVDEGCDLALACGGDGTLSEVMTGLLDSGIPAGLIPAGTGNDFARTVGLDLDPAGAAAQLAEGGPQAVDMLEINGGELWSVNVVGAGFDCKVCERINRRSRLVSGLAAYLLAVGQELAAYRPTHMTVRVDGATWEGPALLVAVCNTRSYGAGIRIAPEADIHDGLADVVLVEHVPRLEFVRAFPKVMKGAHLSHPAVRVWRGREVEVHTQERAAVNVDGDLQAETPLHVSVRPGRGLLWR